MWTATTQRHRIARYQAKLAVASGLAVAALSVSALAAPPIRTSASNTVPACVSSARLMDFLRAQNPKADPMYDGIAKLYKQHGEKYGVRWDYAFFQMAIETGYLAFRRPGGKAGDVKVRQYNFAGIGTTGGGVPGDAYPDMSTGVLAQIQHLVAYSGEAVASPVAPRTRLMQANIIEVSKRLKRPVTFADLSGRWAADKRYGAIIDKIADRFRDGHCSGPAPVEARAGDPRMGDSRNESAKTVPGSVAKPAVLMARADVTPPPAAVPPVAKLEPKLEPKPGIKPDIEFGIKQGSVQVAALTAEPARPVLLVGPAPARRPVPRVQTATMSGGAVTDAGAAPADTQRVGAFAPRQLPDSFGNRTSLGAGGVPAPASRACKITTASYGGTKTLLLKSAAADATTYTLLQVVDGFEASMREKYTATRAPGAEMLGEFTSQDVAMVTAKALCAK